MYTPVQKYKSGMGSQTPRTPISFSRELRQVLQERNLLTAKSRKKVCSMLDSNNSSPLSSPNPEAVKRKDFRLQAIQEIISSEKSYLEQLEMLMNFFVLPLKEHAIIDNINHSALFGQIEMIHNLNGEFLRELESNTENVAQAFLKMAPFFKLYSVYAFDYRGALFILQDLTSKNPVFRKFLEQTESRPEVQRKLNSLMIVPIQRVPRYKLLLEQVLLYTSPADADYKLLKASVKEIENTAAHINSCVEDQEVTQYLINIQNSLVNRTPNIVKPSRKVIKEGVLQKVTRNGEEIKRYCVLMSDIFMYCKILKERSPNTVVENSLECCCIFPLKKCKVYELFPGNFKITCQGDGIIFCTSDLQLGRIWAGFLRDAIDLHIQCRKTLRKESSKLTPIRKKDIKKFGTDSILNPSKRKCDYDTIFRNKSRDSEDENEVSTTTCFPRKRKIPSQVVTHIINDRTNIPMKSKQMKRPRVPPPPPPPPPPLASSQRTSTVITAQPFVELRSDVNNQSLPKENRISKLYKMIANDKTGTRRGILKRTTTSSTTATIVTPANTSNDQDPTYGFASRYSDSKSYFRAHNVDNTIPTAIKREDLFGDGLGDGNFRDVLYPLRLSGGSQKNGEILWSTPPQKVRGKENTIDTLVSPPQKKRVKFDDTLDAPFVFPSGVATNTARTSLRERIYEFFANLF